MSQVVCFGGSRNLSLGFFGLVADVVDAVVGAGQRVSVGCAIGADEMVIDACPSSSLSVFAAFDLDGSGSWSGSAVTSVRVAAGRGARVYGLAGGLLDVPLRARLIRRSLAALAGASSFVVFLSNPVSHGSLRVAAAAVERSIPLFAFACGFSGVPAQPSGCSSGAWQSGEFFGFPCWRLVPAQCSLFKAPA